ncbi:MAG: hypothetical protein IBX64_09485 [Actinobacteria bacterium]|nr:hypothetical protein [Actinomycetota bacterium]
MMKRKKIPYGTKLPVKLTLRERDLISNETFCDPEYIKLAVVDGKGIKVDLSLDEIEDIQGYVAAEANHTEDLKLQKELDRLSDKLQVYLDTYDDQDYEQSDVFTQPIDPFSKDAKKRWDKIPKWAQTKILDNVYCGKCMNMVSIVLETAKIQGANLILRGKCKTCGHEVCRLVEPEND